MFELPFPESKQGWLVAAILAFGLFTIYYWCLFPSLERRYQESFFTNATANESASVSQDLDVTIFVPKYVSSVSPRDIQIHITRKNPDAKAEPTPTAGSGSTSQPQPTTEPTPTAQPTPAAEPETTPEAETTSASGSTTKDSILQVMLVVEQSKVEGESFPQLVYCKEGQHATANCDGAEGYSVISNIPTGGEITRRIWVAARSSSSQDQATLKFKVYIRPANSSEWEDIEGGKSSWTANTTVNLSKAVLQSGIATILLPPWSNGILLVVAIIVASWFDEERE